MQITGAFGREGAAFFGAVLIAWADKFDGGDKGETAGGGEYPHFKGVGEHGGQRKSWSRRRVGRRLQDGETGAVRGHVRRFGRWLFVGGDVDLKPAAAVSVFLHLEFGGQ
jgi:hypothetical protein